MKKLPDSIEPKDLDAWEEVISDINPMSQPLEKPSAPLIIDDIMPSLKTEGLYNQNSFNRLEVGNTDNIDRNTADKFIKGEFKIDAKLDLHGRTEKQAFSAVEDFIKNCYVKGCRCVLIITGKGQNDENRPWYEAKGIIRTALPNWLNHYNIRPFILSIASAKPEDGGSGAFYVLLKRKRL